MSVTKTRNIQRLRPEGMRSIPARMPRVFDDPGAVLELIMGIAPYRTTAAYYNYPTVNGDRADAPWFIDIPEADILLQNPHWIAAAKQVFSARIVQPLHCTVNLNAPAAASPPHMDLPVFRGLSVPEIPVWLLMSMSYSGLFLPWLVPVASGLSWFYRGEGGEFEYWPDGPAQPSIRERTPLWNVGVMGDNEAMWHRVGDIGTPARIAELSGQVSVAATVQRLDGGWEIHDGGKCIFAAAPEEMRISLLWKAYVFSDEDHLASFKNKAYDLDIEQVVEIFLADLAARDIAAFAPADPLNDPDWTVLLRTTYKSPFE